MKNLLQLGFGPRTLCQIDPYSFGNVNLSTTLKLIKIKICVAFIKLIIESAK